ncbi:MAG: hypothetical protein ACREP9_09275, partial [Candidatus Dormibacteraceae bacterium]
MLASHHHRAIREGVSQAVEYPAIDLAPVFHLYTIPRAGQEVEGGSEAPHYGLFHHGFCRLIPKNGRLSSELVPR